MRHMLLLMPKSSIRRFYLKPIFFGINLRIYQGFDLAACWKWLARCFETSQITVKSWLSVIQAKVLLDTRDAVGWTFSIHRFISEMKLFLPGFCQTEN